MTEADRLHLLRVEALEREIAENWERIGDQRGVCALVAKALLWLAQILVRGAR